MFLQNRKIPKNSIPFMSVYRFGLRYDPTRTLSLRNAFVRDFTKRFNKLKKIIRKAVVEEDCFGLKSGSRPRIYAEMYTKGYEAFNFPSSGDKVAAFMDWISAQEDSGLLEITEMPRLGTAINPAWTNKYITDAYSKGISRARNELLSAGYLVPSLGSVGDVFASMSAPVHMDRLGILYTRAFSELKGITSLMDAQISRVLTDGIAQGDNPNLIAKKLVSVISGKDLGDLGIKDSLGRFIPAEKRARTLARTEIVRAHHVATIQEYLNWETQGVFVEIEWQTAGFGVCPLCLNLAKRIYSPKEILGLIPAHPNCRCVAKPVSIKQGKQPKTPKEQKEEALLAKKPAKPVLTKAQKDALNHTRNVGKISEDVLKADYGNDWRLASKVYDKLVSDLNSGELDVWIRRRFNKDSESFKDVFENGKLKSQFLTGTSSGSHSAYKGGRRDDWEHKIFGGSYHKSKEYKSVSARNMLPTSLALERPVYGYLNPHAGMDYAYGYGDVVLKLDTEMVKDRVSYTVTNSSLAKGDPSDTGNIQGGLRSLLNSFFKANSDQGFVKLNDYVAGDILINKLKPISWGYIETQIHGGVDFARDVKAIFIDSEEKAKYAHVLELANKYGIKVEWK